MALSRHNLMNIRLLREIKNYSNIKQKKKKK
jgi:hypothetical protein